MLITMLKSKLHHARVTESELEYNGSLTIDRDLMDGVRLNPYEKILVANMANGERFETYAIPGPRGSGVICLNGATAHKGTVGDRLIVFAFAQLSEEEVASHKPRVTVLDQNNRPVTTAVAPMEI
ncbi:MAG TPA: aspartate 1-decarboxylase [Verrucomicrobia bacterium]|nr:aspartate 1-decarboxylase [Verrucomicrobiota bacterium]